MINSLSDLLQTEEIFLDAIEKMENVFTRHAKDKKFVTDIARESLNYFVDTILLYTIENSFDRLENRKENSFAGLVPHVQQCGRLGLSFGTRY